MLCLLIQAKACSAHLLGLGPIQMTTMPRLESETICGYAHLRALSSHEEASTQQG